MDSSTNSPTSKGPNIHRHHQFSTSQNMLPINANSYNPGDTTPSGFLPLNQQPMGLQSMNRPLGLETLNLSGSTSDANSPVEPQSLGYALHGEGVNNSLGSMSPDEVKEQARRQLADAKLHYESVIQSLGIPRTMIQNPWPDASGTDQAVHVTVGSDSSGDSDPNLPSTLMVHRNDSQIQNAAAVAVAPGRLAPMPSLDQAGGLHVDNSRDEDPPSSKNQVLLEESYAYCYRRKDGRYTRLIPADMLPELKDITRLQPDSAGMIVLPQPLRLPPKGVDSNTCPVVLKTTSHQMEASATGRAAPTGAGKIQVGKTPIPDPKGSLNKAKKGRLTLGSRDRKPQDTIDNIVKGAPTKPTKVYCDKWVHEGVCAFTQQGCKFKHEMPTDTQTQRSLGLFHGLPAWYKRHQADLQRVRSLEGHPSPSAQTKAKKELSPDRGKGGAPVQGTAVWGGKSGARASNSASPLAPIVPGGQLQGSMHNPAHKGRAGFAQAPQGIVGGSTSQPANKWSRLPPPSTASKAVSNPWGPICPPTKQQSQSDKKAVAKSQCNNFDLLGLLDDDEE